MRTISLCSLAFAGTLLCSCGSSSGITPASGGISAFTTRFSGVVSTAGASAPEFPVQYRVVDLGLNAQPEAINNFGAVVGGAPAFYYNKGVMHRLAPVNGDGDGFAYDINDAGAIVGQSDGTDKYQTPRAAEFHLHGSATLLGVPPGYNGSVATSISSNGKIVGLTFVEPECGTDIASFDGHGGATDLGEGLTASVNSSDVIAFSQGLYPTGGCEFQGDNAVELVGSKQIPVPLPPNAVCPQNASNFASDINDAGYIVGTYGIGKPGDCQYGATGTTGFISYGSSAQEILAPNNDHAWNVNGVSDKEWVAGNYFKHSTSTYDAFIWSSGKAVDLNNLIPADSSWQLRNAVDVNDNGWVVGTGTYEGQQHGFLLIPKI